MIPKTVGGEEQIAASCADFHRHTQPLSKLIKALVKKKGSKTGKSKNVSIRLTTQGQKRRKQMKVGENSEDLVVTVFKGTVV